MSTVEKKEKEVIMETTFRAIPMNGNSLVQQLNGENGYVDIGGFEVSVPGYKEAIPFDFESTVGVCNEDGTYRFGNWDGLLERIFDVDPFHEGDWAKNGLTKENITAKLLASAKRLEEFSFHVCDRNDRPITCFLEVLNMDFWDEKDRQYSIDTKVLQDYNRLRVAEQIAELMQPKATYLERKPFMEDFVACMKNENPAGVLGKILSIQNVAARSPGKRALCDFLIDSMLEVSVSKNDIYRVGLAAYGNPDHGEYPDKRLEGVAAGYVYKDSLNQCQVAVCEYIMKNDLGGGNWCGGMVYKGGEYAGNISYNGRFWGKETEYGSPDFLRSTELAKIDASLCGYGKNLFSKEVYKENTSLDAKIKLSELHQKTGNNKQRTDEKEKSSDRNLEK